MTKTSRPSGFRPGFTIRHQSRVRRSEAGRLVSRIETRLHPGFGLTAADALDDLRHRLAQADEFVGEIDGDDPELDDAIDAAHARIDGRFEVYRGTHASLPAGLVPLLVSGRL